MCPVTASSDDELQPAPSEASRQLRAVLAELDDPDDELTASPASRRRIEGAALARETLAVQPATDAAGSSTR
jgi:hypothetical protein